MKGLAHKEGKQTHTTTLMFPISCFVAINVGNFGSGISSQFYFSPLSPCPLQFNNCCSLKMAFVRVLTLCHDIRTASSIIVPHLFALDEQ